MTRAFRQQNANEKQKKHFVQTRKKKMKREMRNKKKASKKEVLKVLYFILFKLIADVCRDCSHANYKINYICA